MSLHSFIFSSERKPRTSRYLVFWAAYCLCGLYTNIEISVPGDLHRAVTYEASLLRVLCYLPMSVFMVYIFTNVLIPRYFLGKKYLIFGMMAFCTILLCFLADILISYVFVHSIYRGSQPTELSESFFLMYYNMAVQKGICMAAICIKLAKGWYLQQVENTRIAEKEAEKRTWLFRSQVQPEFLFHSLQSLYKKIHTSADEAVKMILHLSDIFSYILYDCTDRQILVEMELMAIRNLALAEQMNEERATRISISVNGSYDNKYIAPMSLFSFLRTRIDKSAGEEQIDVVIHIRDRVLEIAAVSDSHTSTASMPIAGAGGVVNDDYQPVEYQYK
jgi:sensor histidine kinase YesM